MPFFMYFCFNNLNNQLMKKICFLFAFSLMAGFMSAQAPISYSVEKDIVHSYLTDFDYDTIPLTVTYIMKYFNMPHVTDPNKPVTDPVNRLDAPNPVKLSWNHEDGAEAQRVEVSESSTYSDSIVFTINKDAAQYDLYNMIPGKHYYYRVVSVKSGNETVVNQGELAPTGMLRWIYAEGTWNVRDMGGWPGLGGNPIRYGQIFRGGQLTNPKDPYNVLLTKSGIEAMRNTGIRAELDLRSSSQAHYSYASFAVKGANGKYDADFTNIATTSARMWKYDYDDSNIKAFQWIINELKAGKPVFYHCQNGADRTGTMGFLIGALLGMSEGNLGKDYELTTFCQEAVIDFDDSEDDNGNFARFRDYTGKKGSYDNNPSSENDYKFAPLIDKLHGIAGSSTQRKIYDFFKNGVNGTKIKESDLDWFIRYMVNYAVVQDITIDCKSVEEIKKGQQIKMNPKVLPEDATNGTLTMTSSDTRVATVSEDGVIKAVGCGDAIITLKADNFVKTVRVSIDKIESTVPASVEIAGESYSPKEGASNKVKDGSFEYGYYYEWKSAKDTAMTSRYFDLTKYSQNADSVYLESKVDGDETSEGSIRMEWTTPKKRTFVFGFRVKNSTNVTTTHNENLKIMLTNDDKPDNDPSAYIFEYPSYSGEWTDVQYAFTTTTQNRLRILFTHLSKDGNNTCFDNFYLIELDVPSGVTVVNPIKAQPAYAKAYDMSGRVVDDNARGIIIKNGKKVLK